MIIVPLISGDEVIGAMNIARTGGSEVAFTDADFELVQLFAGQAAVAITNARLVEELRDPRRRPAQPRRDRGPDRVAPRAADGARPRRGRCRPPAGRRPRADQPASASAARTSTRRSPRRRSGRPPDDVIVPIGSGIAGIGRGRAAGALDRATTSPTRTFPHDEGDARIDAQDIHSMMSAPLLGPDRLIGTITVQSTEPNAFDEPDAELLKLLADQAAIALTNARLLQPRSRSRSAATGTSSTTRRTSSGRSTPTAASRSSATRSRRAPAGSRSSSSASGSPCWPAPPRSAQATEAWRLLRERAEPRAARAPRPAAPRRTGGEDRGGDDRHARRRPVRRRATARCATSASASGSRATSATRRPSWPPARSAPTSRASSTTR